MKKLLFVLVLCAVPSLLTNYGFSSTAIPKFQPNSPSLKIDSSKTVIGSIASVDAHFENGKPVTTIRVLEFGKDSGFGEPALTDVRLCGDQSGSLYGVSNVFLAYNNVSPSALTGCLPLAEAKPWQDNSRWQSITWDKSKVHGSKDLENIIRGVGNGSIK